MKFWAKFLQSWGNETNGLTYVFLLIIELMVVKLKKLSFLGKSLNTSEPRSLEMTHTVIIIPNFRDSQKVFIFKLASFRLSGVVLERYLGIK